MWYIDVPKTQLGDSVCHRTVLVCFKLALLIQKWYIDVAKTQLGANDVDVVNNVINIGSCKW